MITELSKDYALTTRDIATMLGIGERSVQKVVTNNKIIPVGKRGKAGLYNCQQLAKPYPQLLQMVRGIQEDVVPVPTRQGRSDYGTPRGINKHLFQRVKEMALAEFLSDADALVLKGKHWKRKGVRGACTRAVEQLKNQFAEGVLSVPATQEEIDRITLQRVYHNWVIRDDKETSSRNVQQRRGAYWEHDWEAEWVREWKQHDNALIGGKVRYNIPKILENSFDCNRGNGFARFVFLDDWTTKTEITDGEGSGKATYIVATDVLTGAPLWFERADVVTAQSYLRAILAVVTMYGCDRTVWFLENSKAAIASRLENFIRCLYTADDLQYFQRREHKALFMGQGYIVRNVPGIPNAIGKAFGERMNRELRSASALLFPHAFRGSNRKDSVQLNRSNTPVRNSSILPTRQEFESALQGYVFGDYMNRELPSLEAWANEKGMQPTRAQMVQYYTPQEQPQKIQDVERLAMLLYWATLPAQMHEVKIEERGALYVTENGRGYNLRHSAFYDSRNVGVKLHAIPCAWQDGAFVVYRVFAGRVFFVCVAEDFTAEDAMTAERMRTASGAMRKQHATQKNEKAVTESKTVIANRTAAAIEQGAARVVPANVADVLAGIAPAHVQESEAEEVAFEVVVNEEISEQEMQERLAALGL